MVLVLGRLELVLGKELVLHKREPVLRKQGLALGRLSKQELGSKIEQ